MAKEEINDLIQQLQSEICYCDTCQPYEDGEAIWVLGVRRNLEALFDEYNIDEDLRDEISNNLNCPNCGRNLERYDDFGERTPYEKQVDQKQEEWSGRYKDQLDGLAKFIAEYPYLGVKHELGKRIVELMPQFPVTEINNSSWFRARNVLNGKLFSREDMRAPNPEMVAIGEGRFNHYGQSHYYLADSEIGAAKELLAFSDEKLVWMQSVLIISTGPILDVRVGFHEPDLDASLIPTGIIHFSNILNLHVERNKNWKPEYFIPRFVADAAKLAGFQGILYTSSHHYYDNLVIFNPSEINYQLNEDPYIFTLQNEDFTYPF